MTSPDNTKITLFSGDWLDVIKEENREYMVRKICTGIAIIIALNKKNELVLTEQYRVPAGSRVLELPAGMVGDTPEFRDEAPIDTAKRELLEETGYEANSMIQVAEGPISSGISSEVMTFFYTDDIAKKGVGGGDETENITVHTVSLEDVETYLLQQHSQHGVLIDPKVFIGLHFARKLSV